MNPPEAALFPYAVGALSALLGLLVAVLGWVGSQIKGEIKALGDQMKETNLTLAKIDRDLRNELGSLDRRITRVESRFESIHVSMNHGGE